MPNANTYAAKVYQALPLANEEPLDFTDLREKLGWPEESELSLALVSLQEEGVAELHYSTEGRGGFRRRLRKFTVLGVRDDEQGGKLIVAAVIEGDVRPLDNGSYDGWTRWADTFTAENAYEAEQMAYAVINKEES